MNHIETLEQALEFCEFCWRDVPMNEHAFERTEQTIIALRTAIEQAEKREPVAWTSGIPPLCPEMKDGETISAEYVEATPPAADDLIATYEKGFKDGAAQRQPLTDEEMRVIENKINPNMRWRSSDEEGITLYPSEYYELVRAIEAAHGIGEKK